MREQIDYEKMYLDAKKLCREVGFLAREHINLKAEVKRLREGYITQMGSGRNTQCGICGAKSRPAPAIEYHHDGCSLAKKDLFDELKRLREVVGPARKMAMMFPDDEQEPMDCLMPRCCVTELKKLLAKIPRPEVSV